MGANFVYVVWILFFKNVLMFVDWFKNVSAIFVDVYEIYATVCYGTQIWQIYEANLQVINTEVHSICYIAV